MEVKERSSPAETRGLEPAPDHERTGRIRTLFPTWIGANPAALSPTAGAGAVRLPMAPMGAVTTVTEPGPAGIGLQGPGRAATIAISTALHAILPRPVGRARSEGTPLHF